MTLRITVSAPLSPEIRELFAHETRLVFAAYKQVRKMLRLPASQIEVVLPENFDAAVRHYWSGDDRHRDQYTSVREGGLLVGGKCLSQTEDSSRVVIVINPDPWHAHTDDPQAYLREFYLLAHELAHPVIERSRHVTGVYRGEGPLDTRFTGMGRGLGRLLYMEYVADRMADLVLGSVASTTRNGETQPAHYWDIGRECDVATLQSLLEQVSTTWPGTVNDYRNREISLDDMWISVGSSVQNALVYLTHVYAHADASSASDVLRTSPFADSPAVRLYLDEAWHTFVGTLRNLPYWCRLRDVPEVYEHAAVAGDILLRAVLAPLGIAGSDMPEGGYYLSVNEPLEN